ncbi:glycosyl transferase [Modestobacter caceresii]|uniref:Glycosyl transferase n=1 Tax=Modestobacter caceresii TaxID=1522368 RepID=A0A098Y0F7_9ACTN|nr:glycosyltransferase [Modestobacter caceresii]KGH43994.1 glycosyl transferase [Modestobacter caceresii]
MTRPLVVLQSFPTPRPTTNPYLVLLAASITAQPGARLRTFSWRRALLSRYDVFHVHWPEILVSGHSPLKKAVRQLLFVLLLLRLRLLRTPLVRTLHNLHLPEGISRREVVLLRLAECWTTLWIKLNATTPAPPGASSVTIVHGHYRDWFLRHPEPAPEPGHLAFVGLVRRYKGVTGLLDAFVETATGQPGWTLRVAGRPSSDELADELHEAAAADPRVSLHLEFLDDAELVREIGRAELVVLPYREMHNSGGALAALSLDRPVLVPDNEVNRLLADEVGPGWVFRYDGPLTGEDLVAAVTARRAGGAAARPDLGAREWSAAGRAHLDAYRTARAARSRR